jgi:hypothetical protein
VRPIHGVSEGTRNAMNTPHAHQPRTAEAGILQDNPDDLALAVRNLVVASGLISDDEFENAVALRRLMSSSRRGATRTSRHDCLTTRTVPVPRRVTRFRPRHRVSGSSRIPRTPITSSCAPYARATPGRFWGYPRPGTRPTSTGPGRYVNRVPCSPSSARPSRTT